MISLLITSETVTNPPQDGHCLAFWSMLQEICSNSVSKSAQKYFLVYFYWLFGDLISCTPIMPTSQFPSVHPIPCDPPPERKQIHFVASIYSLEYGQTLQVQHSKGRWIFLHLHPCWKLPTVEIRVLAGEGWVQFSCAYATVFSASSSAGPKDIPMSSGSSPAHGHPHGLQW